MGRLKRSSSDCQFDISAKKKRRGKDQNGTRGSRGATRQVRTRKRDKPPGVLYGSCSTAEGTLFELFSTTVNSDGLDDFRNSLARLILHSKKETSHPYLLALVTLVCVLLSVVGTFSARRARLASSAFASEIALQSEKRSPNSRKRRRVRHIAQIRGYKTRGDRRGTGVRNTMHEEIHCAGFGSGFGPGFGFCVCHSRCSLSLNIISIPVYSFSVFQLPSHCSLHVSA
jgi:hypothetical protein